jgi:hypothetical protein
VLAAAAHGSWETALRLHATPHPIPARCAEPRARAQELVEDDAASSANADSSSTASSAFAVAPYAAAVAPSATRLLRSSRQMSVQLAGSLQLRVQPAVVALRDGWANVTRRHPVAYLLASLRPSSSAAQVEGALLCAVKPAVVSAFAALQKQCAVNTGSSAPAVPDLLFYNEEVQDSVGFLAHANSWLQSSSSFCAVSVARGSIMCVLLYVLIPALFAQNLFGPLLTPGLSFDGQIPDAVLHAVRKVTLTSPATSGLACA